MMEVAWIDVSLIAILLWRIAVRWILTQAAPPDAEEFGSGLQWSVPG